MDDDDVMFGCNGPSGDLIPWQSLMSQKLWPYGRV